MNTNGRRRILISLLAIAIAVLLAVSMVGGFSGFPGNPVATFNSGLFGTLNSAPTLDTTALAATGTASA